MFVFFQSIHFNWPVNAGENVYVFSCGHSKSHLVIPKDQNKLPEAYERLDKEGALDMACPDCVCAMLSTKVA